MAPRCLEGFDDVVVHGANGVCGVPEGLAHGPSPWLVALAVGVMLLTALALRGAGGRILTWGIVGFVAVSTASVGWVAISTRGDAPQRMAALAAHETVVLGEVERSAGRASGCVRIPVGPCLACEPMVHLAAPTRNACDSDVAHVGGGVAR